MEPTTFPGPDPGERLQAKVFKAREVGALRRWMREGLAKGAEIPEEDFWVKTIIRGALRPDGIQRFADADVEAMKDMPALTIARMFQPIAQVNGMTDEAEEDIRKNSAPTPGGSNASA